MVGLQNLNCDEVWKGNYRFYDIKISLTGSLAINHLVVILMYRNRN
jgi:hypothetical protein